MYILSSNKSEHIKSIYENHTGRERGYFYLNRYGIPIKKKDDKNNIVTIHGLILINNKYREILIIEGKKFSNLNQGLKEINNFDLIENLHVKKEYSEYDTSRGVVT